MGNEAEALVAEREQQAVEALGDVVAFYKAMRRMHYQRKPCLTIRVMCAELLELDADSDPVAAAKLRDAELSKETGASTGRDRSSAEAPMETESGDRGPGSRSPAGTVTNLVLSFMHDRPGEVQVAREMVDWLVEHGWHKPLRPGHSINLALSRLAAKADSGISRVGPGLWRYDPISSAGPKPVANQDVSSARVRQLMSRRPESTTVPSHATADGELLDSAGDSSSTERRRVI
ncbi:hypothetical protein [Nocardia alni]|uniref:hypothetical protein n=1 Tax=Nocardia alni TaxID=2815723 RepID=UPI001C21B640|nr:hypothetical protein [Nocardia alni]